MAAANALGAFFGARLAIRKGDRLVRVVVLGVVTGAVLKMGYDFGPMSASRIVGIVVPSAGSGLGERLDAIASWMSSRIGVSIVRRDAGSYEALAADVREGRTDVAWLPPIVYLRLGTLVTPLGSMVRGGAVSYEAALIVAASSRIQTIDALRGVSRMV